MKRKLLTCKHCGYRYFSSLNKKGICGKCHNPLNRKRVRKSYIK